MKNKILFLIFIFFVGYTPVFALLDQATCIAKGGIWIASHNYCYSDTGIGDDGGGGSGNVGNKWRCPDKYLSNDKKYCCDPNANTDTSAYFWYGGKCYVKNCDKEYQNAEHDRVEYYSTYCEKKRCTDGGGKYGKSYENNCKGNCDDRTNNDFGGNAGGWKTNGFKGIRYSVVDQNGQLLSDYGFSESLNFIEGTAPTDIYYNAGSGDQTKLAVASSDGSQFKFGDPLDTYNKATDGITEPYFKNLCTLYNYGVTYWSTYDWAAGLPQPKTANCSSALSFFNSMKNTNDASAISNMINLMLALNNFNKDKTSPYKFDNLVRKICEKEIEVYIIQEPMIGMGVRYYTAGAMTKDQCDKQCYNQCTQAPAACQNCMTICQGSLSSYTEGSFNTLFGTVTDLGMMLYNEKIDEDIRKKISEISGIVEDPKARVYSTDCGELKNGTGYSAYLNLKLPLNKATALSLIKNHANKNRFSGVLTTEFVYKYGGSASYASLGDFTSDSSDLGMRGFYLGKAASSCNLNCSYNDGVITSNDPAGSWSTPQNGYPTLAEFAFAKKENGGLNCCTVFRANYGTLIDNPGEWHDAYMKYCCEEGECPEPPNCCTEKTPVTAEPINGEINNCCTDGPLTVAQAGLSDMFCREKDTDLLVDGYYPVCGTEESFNVLGEDQYIYDKENASSVSKYCKLYCSERARVDVPLPFTTFGGRYFTLSKLKTDTDPSSITGPYYQGFKRCRILTAWNRWIKDYDEKVKAEVKAYNEYAKWTAWYDLYKRADDDQINTNKTYSYSVTKTCKGETKSESKVKNCSAKSGAPAGTSCPSGTVSSCGDNCSGESACSATCTSKDTSETKTVTFNKYVFDDIKRQYYPIKVDETYHDLEKRLLSKMLYKQDDDALTDAIAKVPGYDKNQKIVYYETSAQKTANKFEVPEGEKDTDGSCSVTCGHTCTYASAEGLTSDQGYYSKEYDDKVHQDVHASTGTYGGKVTSAISTLATAVGDREDLERALSECESFFLRGGILEDPYSNKLTYKLEPELKFTYTQVYLDEEGIEKTDEIEIPMVAAKGEVCNYDGPWISRTGDFVNDRAETTDTTFKYKTKYEHGYVDEGACAGTTSPPDPEICRPNYSDVYSKVNKSANDKYYEDMYLIDSTKVGSALQTETYKGTVATVKSGYVPDGKFTEIMRKEDNSYWAEKKFTEDAKYRAKCMWNDGENEKHTLYPSGLVYGTDIEASKYKKLNLSNKYISIDQSGHKREYMMYLTSYEGVFETHWYLTGIGEKVKDSEKGRFDDYIAENGSTCSVELGETPAEGGARTCYYKSRRSWINSGQCPPDQIITTLYGTELCGGERWDPFFHFKIVDPANPFPNTTLTDKGYVDSKTSETYGTNWVTEEGKRVMSDILDKSAGNNTYHPNNVGAVWNISGKMATKTNGSFVLSPRTILAIQDYNNHSYAFGGYSDYDLVCNCPAEATRMTVNPDEDEPGNTYRKWTDLTPTEKEGFCRDCKSDFLTELSTFISDKSKTSITYPNSIGDS